MVKILHVEIYLVVNRPMLIQASGNVTHVNASVYQMELLKVGWSYWEMVEAIGRIVSFSIFLAI